MNVSNNNKFLHFLKVTLSGVGRRIGLGAIFILLFATSIFAQQKQRPCVSKEEMDALVARVELRRNEFVKKGLLKPRSARQPAAYNHDFIWPLRTADNYNQPNTYYISKYVDLNSDFNDNLQDYNCGTRTYDTADYNHSGIDIALGPYPWRMMDDQNVEVIAAEGGLIVDKHIGEPDRNCDVFEDPITYYGNYIAIEHSDGVTTYYMHMKNGTVTSKGEMETVTTGEYLGKVGSAGNSSGPHLHFEVRSYANAIWDPFQNGACANNHSGLIGGSFWANEEPYINKKILSVHTLSGSVTNATCDTAGPGSTASTQTVPYSNHFAANTTAFFTAAVRDIESGNTVRLRIIDPNGTTIHDYTYTHLSGFDSMKLLPLRFEILGSSIGTYRLLCNYSGQSFSHYFTVGCPPSLVLSGNRASNSVEISGGSINTTEVILATSQNVENQAETFHQFNPGFEALSGSDFTAKIDNCTIGGLRIGVQNVNIILKK